MRELKATVVGGGIAGLASALALAQTGWRTTVLESRADSAEVGAGVGMPRNGIAALHALGFEDEQIERISVKTSTLGFRDMHGRRLLEIPDDREEVRRMTTVWGFHRQRLHGALWEAAREAGVELRTGTRVTDVVPGVAGGVAPEASVEGGGGRRAGGAPARVSWRTAEGEYSTESDLVVGADGVWSTVRSVLFPEMRPEHSGSTSWRAIVPLKVVQDMGLDNRLIEHWGPGAEFGVMGAGCGEAYWYGYFTHPEKAVFDDELAAAKARFSDWAPEIVGIINATTPEQLMRHDAYHLPDQGLSTYVRGRVLMLGDAAHASYTTLGSGFSTAMEDGITLGRLVGAPVARGQDLGQAMAAFDADRVPRCREISKQAERMARFGSHLGGGWRQTLRNSAMRLMPWRLMAAVGSSVVDWAPPEPSYPSAQADPGRSSR